MLPDFNEHISAMIQQHEKDFYSALEDDFNTPKAFGVLFELLKTINPLLTKRKFDMGNAKHLLEFFTTVGSMLGIMPHDLQKLPKTIDLIVDQRERARQSKDFAMADKLRTQIEEAGYRVDDTAYGPLVKKN